MADVNLVVMGGRLGRDPEMRYTPSGTAITSTSLANDRSWFKKGEGGQGGEWQNETNWLQVTAFGATADRMAEKFSKGDRVLITGRLQIDEWVDKTTNAKREKPVLHVERIELLAGSTKSSGSSSDNSDAATSDTEDDSVPWD